MRTVIRWRWAILVLWIIAVAALMFTAPDFNRLVQEKGQVKVPAGYSSSIAAQLIQESKGESAGSDELSAVLVFHNDKGLNEADQAAMKQGVAGLKDTEAQTGITSVTSYYDQPELKDQMLSKDGTTVLVLLNIARNDRSDEQLSEVLYSAASTVNVEHYYTGEWLINLDQTTSSMEGLKKTELITVGFILIILFIVFRSVVAPLVPLLAVGLSYVMSQSIVSFLAEYANFPISNFTQIFMVAVMFGIGTDYCILLISRFKEELAHTGGDKTEAIIATYRNAGRTVLFSGAAVLVGFASIGFSTFVLYRSAVAVAVGVAVLLLALVTLVPFFMATLGAGLFWPSKGKLEHSQNRLWGAMGQFSLRKPLLALLVLAILLVPFLASYKQYISFNSLEEIGDKYNSVKAFNLIADSFGPGDSMPSTVVIKSDKPMDTKEGLAALEQVSRELANVDGVKMVRSVTRPTGDPLSDLQVTTQAGTLRSGIGEGASGLTKIGSGLSDASSALSENAPKLKEAVKGAGDLITGTNQLKSGVEQLGNGLDAIQKGLKDGSAGAAELSAGLKSAKESADKLTAASKTLLASYEQIGGGLSQLSTAYGEIATQQSSLTSGLGGLKSSLESIGAKHPDLQNDADYKAALKTLGGLQNGAAELASQLAKVNKQLSKLSGGVAQANAGFKQAADGQAALSVGLAKLAQGIDSLQKGVSQAADGQGKVISKLPSITKGLDSLVDGQKQLQEGFTSLDSQLSELTGGLNQSVDGLTKVADGLDSAESYLNELADAPNKELTGWNIPDQALSDKDYQAALDTYLSKDRKTATIDVVFAGNPYDEKTLNEIPAVNDAVKRGLKGTSFEKAEFAVGGITSTQHDLNTISNGDYSRTVILMLIGISIILLLLFRSIVIPLYLVASLVLTYYASMAVAEVIFVRILGGSGISWPVPFFSFVLLMALGVDYSIFLMDRFREYRHMAPNEAILLAMKNMGGVIMSAAVILGGTFAAMLPSGVLSLMQIATVVLCGLFLYALIILPLFIPVMVRTFGPANWWPFMDSKSQE